MCEGCTSPVWFWLLLVVAGPHSCLGAYYDVGYQTYTDPDRNQGSRCARCCRYQPRSGPHRGRALPSPWPRSGPPIMLGSVKCRVQRADVLQTRQQAGWGMTQLSSRGGSNTLRSEGPSAQSYPPARAACGSNPAGFGTHRGRLAGVGVAGMARGPQVSQRSTLP